MCPLLASPHSRKNPASLMAKAVMIYSAKKKSTHIRKAMLSAAIKPRL
jgi:hypothetical protein